MRPPIATKSQLIAALEFIEFFVSLRLRSAYHDQHARRIRNINTSQSQVKQFVTEF